MIRLRKVNKRAEKAALQKLGKESHLLEAHRCIDRKTARKWREDHNNRNYPSEKWFFNEVKRRSLKPPVRNMRICNDRFFGDFVWPLEKLVVEIDGKSHDEPEQIKHDITRDIIVRAFGLTVIRIRYNDNNKLIAFFKEWEDRLRSIQQVEELVSEPRVNPKKTIKKMMAEKRKISEDRMLLKKRIRCAVEMARRRPGGSDWLAKEFSKLGVSIEEAKKMYF